MSLVNAYNWRDGAKNHKKIYIMKIYKDKKKKGIWINRGKFPYIYRVAQKGGGQLAYTVAFLPSLGHSINMIFIRRLNIDKEWN